MHSDNLRIKSVSVEADSFEGREVFTNLYNPEVEVKQIVRDCRGARAKTDGGCKCSECPKAIIETIVVMKATSSTIDIRRPVPAFISKHKTFC